ncbi:MAG: T9SS type A sorting domain-containing protein [Bacteroidales bacterium]|nr:T9SS type A sorting domain-containing protein [Bacteroidales bacterium]MCF8454531.1 T9SS type A sorting domain-containing protein [Bacteroidales bacterium]
MRKILILIGLFLFFYAHTPGLGQTVDTCMVKVKLEVGDGHWVAFDTSIINHDCDWNEVDRILKSLDLDSIIKTAEIDFDKHANSPISFLKNVYMVKCDSTLPDGEQLRTVIKVFADSTDEVIQFESMDDMFEKIDLDMDVIREKLGDNDFQMFMDKDIDIDSLLKTKDGEPIFLSKDGNVHVICGDTDGEKKIMVKTIVEDKDGEMITKVITTDKNGNEIMIEDDDMEVITDGDEKIIKHKINVKEGKCAEVIILKMGACKIKIEDFSRKEKANMPDVLNLKSKDKLKPDNLKYFPNPNEGRFTLSFDLPENGEASITIFDMAGKELFRDSTTAQSKSYESQIDISEYGKGTYILKIETGDKACSKKIIVE